MRLCQAADDVFNLTTSRSMLATVAKFSGVRSLSGIAISKAASTSSINRTAAIELRPASRKSTFAVSPSNPVNLGADAQANSNNLEKREVLSNMPQPFLANAV
jgi:hypothetical protein